MVVTRFSSYYEKFTDGKVVCIDEEIPFEIPSTWEWCRISHIFLHTSGKQQSSNNKGNGTPQKFITTSNLYWGRFKLDNVKVMNFTEEEIKNCSATKGDLLVCEGGAGYGRSAIWDKEYDICLQNHVHRLRPLLKGICEYVYYYIYLLKESNQLASVGTAMPGLSANRLKGLLLPLPPYQEQHHIVSKLKEVIPYVERFGETEDALSRLNSEIRVYLKKSILQEAIQGKLVLQNALDEPASALLQRIKEEKLRLAKEGKLKKKDVVDSVIFKGDDNRYYEKKGKENIDITEEIPFEIPENWEWCRMQDVMDFINGRAYKKDELLSNGKYKVLRVGNFFTNDSWYYSDLELPDDKYCYHGDLLYAWSASFGPQIWEGEKTIFHYHIWNVKYKQDVLYRDYLYYFLLADKANIKNSTTGSTMIHVSMENMKPRFIPIPPLAEQRRIVETLKILLNKIKGN